MHSRSWVRIGLGFRRIAAVAAVVVAVVEAALGTGTSLGGATFFRVPFLVQF